MMFKHAIGDDGLKVIKTFIYYYYYYYYFSVFIQDKNISIFTYVQFIEIKLHPCLSCLKEN